MATTKHTKRTTHAYTCTVCNYMHVTLYAVLAVSKQWGWENWESMHCIQTVTIYMLMHPQHASACADTIEWSQSKCSCRLAPTSIMQYTSVYCWMLTSVVRTAAAIPTPITIKRLRIHKLDGTCMYNNYINRLIQQEINFKHCNDYN